MTDDLKAAIEAVGFHKFHFDGVGRGEEFATVLALAEIGRLAVEARQRALRDRGGRMSVYATEDYRDEAIDAFLAGRGT